MDILNVVRKAYLRKSETSIVSLIFLIIALAIIIWFQTVSVPILSGFFNLDSASSKRLMLEFALNLLTAIMLMVVSFVWLVFVFKDDYDDYGYSYDEEENLNKYKFIYGITSLSLFMGL